MFKARANGFWLKFPNGVVLSTQFAWGNYCEGHELYFKKVIEDKEDYAKVREEVKTSEIAIGNNNNSTLLTELMNKEVFGVELGDSVKGYVGIEDWIKIVNWCFNYKQEKQ